MAYADQTMSGNKITAIVIVALIHIFLGYALVTGLAYSAVQKVMQKVTTVDIKEEKPKEELSVMLGFIMAHSGKTNREFIVDKEQNDSHMIAELPYLSRRKFGIEALPTFKGRGDWLLL